MAELVIKNLEVKDIEKFHILLSEIVKNDLNVYSELQKEQFLNKYYSQEKLKVIVEGNYSKILIGTINDEIIAFLFADKTFAGVGFITWFGVSNKYRRQGYSKKMLNSYINYCKEQKAHLIEVYTFSEKIEFYKKMGFKLIGVRERGFFGVENVIMDKVL